MAAASPNIIMILADDMGFSDIGCFGSEIKTPHLDRLAERGVRFTQMYNGARCCPSRAMLLTGLYAHQAGIGGMVNNQGIQAYQGYLRKDAVTIAEVLREHGYRTILSGKWHVGGDYYIPDPEQWERDAGNDGHPTPMQRGFDRFYGTLSGAGSYFRPPTLMHDGVFVGPTGDEYYFTDAITQHAIHETGHAIADETPFFLYLAFTAPHWPLHALPEDIDRYRGAYLCGWDVIRERRYQRLREEGLLDEAWPLSPRDPNAVPWEAATNPEWEDARMATYAAQVDRMDRNIGLLLEHLEIHGELDNTLIVFMSDNGGCAEFLREDGEEGAWPEIYSVPGRDGRPTRVGNNPHHEPGPEVNFMSYDLPWANASNTPFRLFKSWVHEGGIGTPAIISWPEAMAEPGSICRDVCHLIDLMPTFLEAAGAEYPREFGGQSIQPMAGQSLLPLVTGDGTWEAGRLLFWEHLRNCAVRRGNWKLVCDHRNGAHNWELYDLSLDRTELQDRASDHPALVSELSAAYHSWARQVGVKP